MAIAQNPIRMSSAISVILALTLAAEPMAQTSPPKMPRAGIILTGSIGFAMIAAGAGFEIYGRAGMDPSASPVPHAESLFVGGTSLIVGGLCVLLIAVLLDQWYTPKTFYGVQW